VLRLSPAEFFFHAKYPEHLCEEALGFRTLAELLEAANPDMRFTQTHVSDSTLWRLKRERPLPPVTWVVDHGDAAADACALQFEGVSLT